MPFCATCGASVPETATFCPSCGTARAGVVGLAPPPVVARAGPPRPVGATREPWLVVLLGFVTLGIYALVFWWQSSKEVDAFRGEPGRAHGKVKAGVLTAVAAVAVFVVGIFSVVGAAVSAAANAGSDSPSPSVLAGAGVFMLALFAGFALALVAAVLLYMGLWRVWQAIETDERARGVPSPLSPGLMLVFVLVPYLNLVGTWIALYKTVKGLNGMWAAESARSAGAAHAWGSGSP